MTAKYRTPISEDFSIEYLTCFLLDAFSELRTIPALWDLSEFSMEVKPAVRNQFEPYTSDHDPALPGIEIEDTGKEVSPRYTDPFPEPRTYPAHWNLYSS